MRSYDFIKDYSFYQIPIARCLKYFLKFIFSNYEIRFQAKKDRKAYIYNIFRMFKREAKLNEYILYEKNASQKLITQKSSIYWKDVIIFIVKEINLFPSI